MKQSLRRSTSNGASHKARSVTGWLSDLISRFSGLLFNSIWSQVVLAILWVIMGSAVFEMLNFQVRIGSIRRTTPSPVHTRIAAVLNACVPVYARLRYEKLDRSNSSHRFPICTVVRLRSRSWCSHWTPSDRPVASRRSLRRVPSRPVECELGLNLVLEKPTKDERVPYADWVYGPQPAKTAPRVKPF